MPILARVGGVTTVAIGTSGQLTSPGGGMVSAPPVGSLRVVNVYVDKDGKLVVQYDDVPATSATSGGLANTAPSGCFKATNLYVDRDRKLVIQYSDVPET